MQGWELSAYDHFLRSQRADPIDQTILVVGITEPELEITELSSISDENLEKLLNKLYQAGATVVGLDLVRDGPISPEYAQLIRYFGDSDKLITACGTSASSQDNSELEPSPHANPEGIGLAEFSRDKDLTARRHLLAMDSIVGKCQADFAFSTLLAYQYLLTQQPAVKETEASANYWRWGSRYIPLLRSPAGGYQREDMSGDTVLLNYRIAKEPTEPPFKVVTLTEVLSGEVPDALIKDRIVLIGTNARSIDDKVKTPFRTRSGVQVEIPGVVFHAHQISQLVDVVLGNRPLLRPLSVWADGGWIAAWAGVGALMAGVIVVRGHRSPLFRYFLIAIAGATGTLYVICWAGFVWLGLWLPLVPSVLSLTTTASFYYITHIQKRSITPL